MRAGTLAALYIVIAILFVMAVASEVFTTDVMRPTSLFGALVINVLISGILASVIVERINAKLLD